MTWRALSISLYLHVRGGGVIHDGDLHDLGGGRDLALRPGLRPGDRLGDRRLNLGTDG